MKISYKNESGLTLIEVLVSTVLLIIILSIFLTVFVQSATTNKTSEEIITATYIAQKELESLYAMNSIDSLEDTLTSPEYLIKPDLMVEGKMWKVFEKVEDEQGYITRVRMRTVEDYEGLTRVIVEIFEGSIKDNKSNLQAKMENIFEWRLEFY